MSARSRWSKGALPTRSSRPSRTCATLASSRREEGSGGKMEFLLTQTVNGLVYGMTLFLIAAGLSLIFGLMNVVNVAHGSFFMLGAFFGFTVEHLTGSFWLAVLLAPLPAVALGAVMERVFMRGL